MDYGQTKSDPRNAKSQSSNREKGSQRITKYQVQTTTRKSTLLKGIRQSRDRAGFTAHRPHRQTCPSISISNAHSIENSPINPKSFVLSQKHQQSQKVDCKDTGPQKIHHPQHKFEGTNTEQTSLHQVSLVGSHQSIEPNRKRKRSEAKSSRAQDSPADSRALISLKSCAVEKKEAASGTDNSKNHSINHWIQEGNWPRKYFEEESEMNNLLARKRSSSLRHKQSESGSTTDTLNDQKARDLKTAPYKDSQYATLLAAQGSHMDQSHLGISDTSTSLCQTLLNSDQVTPTNSLFHDDLFYETCRSVQSRNEARIIRDISPLISPSAEVLAIHNSITPKLLTDGVDQGWNNSIPITKVRPQPDYSVGFSQSAFTKGQLAKLSPYIGGLYDASFFMATYFMYFPFFTCETKCGVAGLDIADRQNAHSMTLAVRGVVELFRLAKREDEVHRRILAFSISHDATTVRIYGHYPLIDGKDTTYFRHPIRSYDITDQEGKEKWTAYRFTKSVYAVFMPEHLERIRSAVDAIPADINFEASLNKSTPSDKESESSSLSSSLQGTAETSPLAEGAEPSKKPKLRPTVMLQQEIDYLKQQLAQEREEKKRLLDMLQPK